MKRESFKHNHSSERRRFQRVGIASFTSYSSALSPLKLIWPTSETVNVFDFSYGGMAAALPYNEELQEGKLITFKLRLKNFKPVTLNGEVVWISKNRVGLNFEPMSVVARQWVTDFIEDKLSGSQLHLVSKKYYATTLSCDFWYQSSLPLNLYFWVKDRSVYSAIMELEGSSLTFSTLKLSDKLTDKLMFGSTGLYPCQPHIIIKKAIDILSQIHNQDLKIQGFATKLEKAYKLGI